MFAAALGLVSAAFCMCLLWRSKPRMNASAFAIYLAVVLVWGTLDIHYHNRQMFVHSMSGGRSYEVYFTWWFLPASWIP
jgi:intracellular septation protein A